MRTVLFKDFEFEVEEWVNYIAMDKDGYWYAYKHKPTLNTYHNIHDIKNKFALYALVDEVNNKKTLNWDELIYLSRDITVVIPEWDKL